MIATQLPIFPPDSAPLPSTPDTDQSALPNGWKWVKLGTVCEKIQKTGLRFQKPESAFQYVDIDAIDNHKYKIVSPKDYIWATAPSRAQQIIRAKDVLFSTVRTYLKNIAQVPDTLDNQIASTGFCVLRAGKQLDNLFLFHYILSEEFLRPLNEIQRGTSYPAVRNSDVLDQLIPLPPLAEQQRIMARIEELLSEVNAGVTEIETALKRLKTYRQAVLHHFLSNEEWERVKLGSISNSIRNGISAKPDQASGLRILRISAVRPNTITLNDVRYLNQRKEYESYILDAGDLLFTRYNGSIDYTGVCAVFKPIDNQPIVHPDKLIRVKVNSNFCLPDFVSYSVNSGMGRAFVRQRIRTTAGQSGISGTDVKAIPILLPDLTTQNRIVQEIETRLSQADALEATLRNELQRAGRLRQSVLKQAFMGKLIPSGPL